MSQLVVVVVEGVLGKSQHGSMSAARPIEGGIAVFRSMVESGLRVALVTERDQAGVERFLSGQRLSGQAFVKYADDLEAALWEMQANGHQVLLAVTPRKLAVDRVSQAVFFEWIPEADPLISSGISQRRRPDWGELVGTPDEEDEPVGEG